MLRKFAAAAGLVALCAPVTAGEAADLLRAALYEGEHIVAVERLPELANAGDEEARFALGMLDFVIGIQWLARDLYKYGLGAPETGPLGPVLGVPVPYNQTPEVLTYDKFRVVLVDLVENMDGARERLLAAGESGDYVVPIDLLKVRIDVNGDGLSEASESIGKMFAAAIGADAAPFMADPAPAPAPEGTGDKVNKPGIMANPPPPEAVVGFDRADAIWLAGYSQIIASQADFLLAHDFEVTVNAVFHRLFPRAGLPMQDYSETGMLMMDPETDTAIADLVAAIHTVNWPVVEPERLQRVRTRFQTITSLSRRNWEAILAETDDEHELLPNPQQTPLVPEGKISDEVVAAWMETLDVADKVLAGELLVPHWRFKEGFDLKAYFETATRTDLVMLLTGYDARSYIKPGPVASAESFAAANRVFGDDFLGYLFWFN